MMTEQELVKLCLVRVCQRAGYDAQQRLTQRDLELLCDHIEDKTNVLISLSTMKRLINGQFSRLPQVATLNAISTYLGYDNWQAFKLEQKQDKITKAETYTAAPLPAAPPHKANRSLYYKIGGGVLAVSLVVLILASRSSSGHIKIDANKASFSARRITSNDIPNTVVFNYNIDGIEGDSFFIQQSWDDNRRVRIHKNTYTLTDIYYEPGYHVAKLIVNDRMIKTIDVNIPSNGWFFAAWRKVPASIPTYIKPGNIADKGIMGFTIDDVVEAGVDTSEEHTYCYTYFPGKQVVSSDNFVLKARLKVVPVNNPACPKLMAEINTNQTFMYFRATTPGCISNIDALFGEHYVSGKTTDLSGLGCDITQWQQYELKVENKLAVIRINDKEVFRKQYSKSIGQLAGLGFTSNGLVQLDSVSLKGLDGTVVYADNFDHEQ